MSARESEDAGGLVGMGTSTRTASHVPVGASSGLSRVSTLDVLGGVKGVARSDFDDAALQ